jgi:hypothetical protein|tara:strand:+ start:280 stop:402 length:123 start_codon:yes stop_codon:yes gene_type:complete
MLSISVKLNMRCTIAAAARKLTKVKKKMKKRAVARVVAEV